MVTGRICNKKRMRLLSAAMTVKIKLFLFVFVLAGCDTPYDVFYEIENRTDKVVFIDADFWNPKKGTHEKDISFTCAAGETVRIFSDGGVNLKDYVPEDLFSFPDGIIPHNFDKCDVYIDGVLMSDSLRCRKNWDYVAKKLLGVYTLRITEESVAAFRK